MRVAFGVFLLAFGLLVGLIMGGALTQMALGREGRMALVVRQMSEREATTERGIRLRALAAGAGCVGVACLGALILHHPTAPTLVVSDGVDRALVAGFLLLGFGGGLAFWAALLWDRLRVRREEKEAG